MKSRIEVQLASRLPGIPDARSFRKWLLAALPLPAEMALRVVNAAEASRLNNEFRGRNYATNVLTFVYHEPNPATLAGDIVLCAPVVRREAREQGKALMAHYAHLTIHGALHLAGMDHESPADARAMEAREIAILSAIGFPDPYR